MCKDLYLIYTVDVKEAYNITDTEKTVIQIEQMWSISELHSNYLKVLVGCLRPFSVPK